MNNDVIQETSYIAKTSGLKSKDYIGYALGDTAGCLCFSLVTTILQTFYTDVFLLNPLFIMIMFVAARLWDAINDPIMGRIVDKMKVSRWGRYRPWFLYASAPLILSAILMFVRFNGLTADVNPVGTAIYATVTYVFFGMSYTMLQIPYGSLASVVTSDEKERTKLSVFRSLGATLGSMPIVLVTSLPFAYTTNTAGNKILNYGPILISVIVMCLFSLLFLFLAFRLNKERVIAQPKAVAEKGETVKIYKALLKNRTFMSISIISLLLLAGQMFTQSFYVYLFKNYFGKPWMNIASQACTYGPMLVMMFLTPKMVRKWGKKEICAVGMSVAALANLVLFFLRGMDPNVLWIIFMLGCLISGFGLNTIVLQVWAFVGDTIDESEVKDGRRDDGTVYSAFMFFRKLGQALAAIAVNSALLAMDYSKVTSGQLTDANLSMMYDMATIIPAVMFGAMAIMLFVWYPLSKKKVADLQVAKEEVLRQKTLANEIKIGE